jgi:hypothetical protein
MNARFITVYVAYLAFFAPLGSFEKARAIRGLQKCAPDTRESPTCVTEAK